jgi:peptide-methionine (R)-S-oxide reductase
MFLHFIFPFLLLFISCENIPLQQQITQKSMQDSIVPTIIKTDEEWRKTLTDEQFRVLRDKGTERPFTGEYNLLEDKGTYHCAGCGAALFTHNNKFISHCGWPSFDAVKQTGSIKEVLDNTHGMVRTEVVCAACGGHLGHLFDDGPTATGMRYCINSVSLKFEKDSIE